MSYPLIIILYRPIPAGASQLELVATSENQFQPDFLDDNGETTCKPETTKYRFSFYEDGTIDCSKNKPGCKRDLCLCDKEFAETVATHEVNTAL